jgi:S1-C subfamily serine protease
MNACRLSTLAAAALAALALFHTLAPALHAQHGSPGVMQSDGSDAALLLELGALLDDHPAGDAAVVLRVAEAERRAAAYREVELAEGDRILAVNGRRVRGAEAAMGAYEGIAVGQPVELGIERQAAGGEPQRRIVRFAKGDPATLPRPQMRMVRIAPDPNAEMDVMPALGAVVRQKHDEGSPVEVAAVLPNGESIFREGDRIVALDGQPVTELAAFGLRWDAIAVGAKVTLVLENAGRRRTETFARPEAPEGQRIIRQGTGQH